MLKILTEIIHYHRERFIDLDKIELAKFAYGGKAK